MDREISRWKSKPLGIFQHDQVDRQESPSSDITQCPTETGDPSDILVRGDFWKEGIIKDISFRKTDIGDDEENRSHPIIARMNKIKEAREEDTGETENH